MSKPVSVFDQLDQGANPAEQNAAVAKPVVEPVAAPVASAGAPPVRPASLQPRKPTAVTAPADSLAAGEKLAPGETLGTSGTNADVTAPLANADVNDLRALVKLLMTRESREIKEMQDAEERNRVRLEQRLKNARDKDSKQLAKQARCKHLKGGKGGPKTQNKDYAVSHHRFPNNVQYIRCLICGMKWYPRDTVEYLSREGKNGKIHEIGNHTHIGWREAVNMMEGSTNTLTASESLPSVSPNSGGVFLDAAGLPVVPRIRDKEGKEVESVVI